MIDQAHHHSTARLALDETVEFDKTINTTIHLMKEWNMLDDTLLIVTSDHANSMSINGYPKRGNSILGVAGVSQTDEVKYTTLTYCVGYSPYPIYTRTGSEVIRQDPTVSNTISHDYSQQVGILEETGIHGGSDVAVYAQGKCIIGKINNYKLFNNYCYRTNGTLIPFDSRTKLYCACNSICIKNWSLPKWNHQQQITLQFFKHLPCMHISFDYISFKLNLLQLLLSI